MQTVKNIIVNAKNMNKAKAFLNVFLALFFVFLISIAVSPLHKMKEFESIVESDSVFSANFNRLWSHAELSTLIKEKTNKQALLKLAESDSIQLAINLADSSVCLYIKGVKIHKSDIRKFEKDRLFQKMPSLQYVKIFSEPVKIISQYATIVKEPVVVRHAPKDTAEAALTAWEPDTLVQKPAFLLLEMDYGMWIVIEQELSESMADKWVKNSFYARLCYEKSIEALGHFVTFRKQEYHPSIKISLPVDELRAIYRALPQNTEAVIHF